MVREASACRVCMKKSKDSVELEAIFLRKPRMTYLEGYNICTQLNALINDGLPKNLCPHCKDELRAAFRFMEKAKETDRKLREKLGLHRVTRSNRRIKQEECHNKMLQAHLDVETIFEEIKTEFINCSKDPLEDTDLEVDERSEDEIEMNWISDAANNTHADAFLDGRISAEDDDEDDRPLKELIKKEKQKSSFNDFSKFNNSLDTPDVFNDFPEPDHFSSDDDDAFNDKMFEHVPEKSTTPEAQIFPQGRYICKICQKSYFTAAGLKAHIAVHMPKKKKDKRIRGPNKKKTKNKKKAGDGEDEDDTEGGVVGDNAEVNKTDESNEKKTIDQSPTPKEANDSTSTKENESVTADDTDTTGKKKRKGKTPKPKKMFPCHVCGKHMISASKLRYHMVMHTGEKDYLCTMCPKAYSTIYALKHHMRTHTGERPYECKFCGDKFTRPTTLKSHMRRHTGERPYGCDICGKRFIQHSSMTTHMKLNHMAKTIACPHCDKKYARQTDLNTHLLSHTGDKPFSCELCPSRFIRQANLNKHMHQHHSTKGGGGNATAAALAQPQPQTQSQTPLPRVIDVRSLAKTTTPVITSRVQVIATPPAANIVASDENNGSNHSNHMLATSLQPATQQHQQTPHMSSHTQMGPPPPPPLTQSRPTNSENSIPMSVNVAGIPGTTLSSHMLSTLQTSAGTVTHITSHGRLESVTHLKAIHPAVNNLPNLLGPDFDPERMGRSTDEDMMRWNWSNTS